MRTHQREKRRRVRRRTSAPQATLPTRPAAPCKLLQVYCAPPTQATGIAFPLTSLVRLVDRLPSACIRYTSE
jgi:hypothetical protein